MYGTVRFDPINGQGASMTTSIQSLDAPLALRMPDTKGLPETADSATDVTVIRTFARALEGMQKEAIVLRGGGQPAWRLICDEGQYLHGTDLAPPPLAFFSAGMASIFTAAISRELNRSGHSHTGLIVAQDAYYGMQGSALRGTMTASADSVELRVRLPADVPTGDYPDRLATAISGTPIESLMQTSLADTFSIERNHKLMATGDVNQSSSPRPSNPAPLFERTASSRAETYRKDIVTKLASAESVFDADHGVGAALKDHQKRTLLIRSQVSLREDGLQQIRVRIHRPIGSVFQFLVDEGADCNGGGQRAPDGLSYVSAGIAFCYMTQLGRYIQITKRAVENYNVVQDTRFDLGRGTVLPVDTHVYLKTEEDEAICRKIVAMAEQTCFLHAACRTSKTTNLCIETDASVNKVVADAAATKRVEG